MARRIRGSGTISKARDRRGRPIKRGAVELPPGPDGKRRRKWFTGHSQIAVDQKINEWKLEQARLAAVKPIRTFGDYLSEWLAAHRVTVTESHAVRLDQILRTLPPELLAVPLAEVGPRDLERAYAKLAGRYAPATVLKVHRTLFTALKRAEQLGELPRNVAALAQPPRVPRQEVTPLTPTQISALLRALIGDRLEALVILALSTGMRQGELLALRWQDIDWGQPASVMVRGSARRLPSDGLKRRDTKTHRSRRLELTPSALAALKAQHDRQTQDRAEAGDHWLDQDLVFPNTTGGLVERTLFLRQWYRLLERAALPRTLFKDATRHTVPSLLVAGHVHPRAMADLLGHSAVNITLDRYSHILPGVQSEAVSVLEAALQTARQQATIDAEDGRR